MLMKKSNERVCVCVSIYIKCSYNFCISLSDCTIHSSSPSEDKNFFLCSKRPARLWDHRASFLRVPVFFPGFNLAGE